jgi:streptomycin 6-kinase
MSDDLRGEPGETLPGAAPATAGLDLTAARGIAERAARHWGRRLEPAFALAAVSYVAPAGDAVVKVAWEGDEESLHEADALRLWDGHGAIQLLDQYERALLIERASPGCDLAELNEREATELAVELAARLWRPATPPFRPVLPEVVRWLDHAEQQGSELVGTARELLSELEAGSDWVVHGDFHHHNILRHGGRYVAIDPKPYLADREYDVASFLWNPLGNRLDDRDLLERRIAAFVAAGLSDRRIRAWTVIRGAYLRPTQAEAIRSLLS